MHALKIRLNRLHVVAFLLFATGLFAQNNTGEITGRVVDENGRPIPHAQVSPQFTGFALMHSLVITVDADQEGNFRIDHLQWGSYAVYANKESDAYPNTRFAVYRMHPVPHVTLSPEHPVAVVEIKLGPRAGKLIAQVRDAYSHKPLPIRLTIQRPDGSGQMVVGEPPDFSLLVPANTDVALEIRCDGYTPWRYTDSSQHWLRLRSGEQKDLEIALVPSRR